MSQTLRIVLIDDNPGDRTLVIRELRRSFSHLQIQEIKEARGFTQIVAADEFDLVITDYQLGWSNGLEVLRTIKEHYPSCPVIMFTNTGTEEIAVEAMKSGLDDYIVKAPKRYIRVPAAVRSVLKRTEAQRRADLLNIRLETLLEQLRVGSFRANQEGSLLESNPAFLDLLGVTSLEQVQAMNLWNLRESYLELEALTPPQRIEQELQIRRADGNLIWISSSLTLNTIDGETVLDGLIEDITPRKQAEVTLQQLNEELEERVRERTQELEAVNQELAAMNQKLEAANQDLEEFAYSVSHDLREPLRSIQGLAQALLADYATHLDSTGQLYVRRIFDNTQQTDILIQDLLAYSRISRTEIPLGSIDLSSVMAEILAQLDLVLQQRQARVTVERPLPQVVGNRLILIQVVKNLLTNAIKFVAPNVQPDVRVWAEERGTNELELVSGNQTDSSLPPTPHYPLSPEGTPSSPVQWVRLWVQDNGIGIAPEQHQRIFNVFVRLHGSEVYPGTGIGLAIVRKGIERLGGRVGVESQPGEGSRFWIDLPKVTES